MKKLISVSLVLCSLLLCLVSCKENKNTVFTADEDIHTEYAGVYLTYKSVDTDSGGHKVLNAFWHNETDGDVIYGEAYSIEYKNGNAWTDITPQDLSFNEIAHILEPQATVAKSYSTEKFDMSKEGDYRLVCQFSAKDGTGYKTWVEFNIAKQA